MRPKVSTAARRFRSGSSSFTAIFASGSTTTPYHEARSRQPRVLSASGPYLHLRHTGGTTVRPLVRISYLLSLELGECANLRSHSLPTDCTPATRACLRFPSANLDLGKAVGALDPIGCRVLCRSAAAWARLILTAVDLEFLSAFTCDPLHKRSPFCRRTAVLQRQLG
jgi:hypothetical protein